MRVLIQAAFDIVCNVSFTTYKKYIDGYVKCDKICAFRHIMEHMPFV